MLFYLFISVVRLKKNNMKLGDLDGLLNWRRDTKIASLCASLPLPISDQGYEASLSSFDPLPPLLDLCSPDNQKVSKAIENIGKIRILIPPLFLFFIFWCVCA